MSINPMEFLERVIHPKPGRVEDKQMSFEEMIDCLATLIFEEIELLNQLNAEEKKTLFHTLLLRKKESGSTDVRVNYLFTKYILIVDETSSLLDSLPGDEALVFYKHVVYNTKSISETTLKMFPRISTSLSVSEKDLLLAMMLSKLDKEALHYFIQNKACFGLDPRSHPERCKDFILSTLGSMTPGDNLAASVIPFLKECAFSPEERLLILVKLKQAGSLFELLIGEERVIAPHELISAFLPRKWDTSHSEVRHAAEMFWQRKVASIAAVSEEEMRLKLRTLCFFFEQALADFSRIALDSKTSNFFSAFMLRRPMWCLELIFSLVPISLLVEQPEMLERFSHLMQKWCDVLATCPQDALVQVFDRTHTEVEKMSEEQISKIHLELILAPFKKMIPSQEQKEIISKINWNMLQSDPRHSAVFYEFLFTATCRIRSLYGRDKALCAKEVELIKEMFRLQFL